MLQKAAGHLGGGGGVGAGAPPTPSSSPPRSAPERTEKMFSRLSAFFQALFVKLGAVKKPRR